MISIPRSSDRSRSAMHTRCFALIAALTVCALTAPMASAVSFTVTLENGTSFETRYRPAEADWDENLALIRTDVGNWIAVPKADIVDVVSQAEVSGFGYQLDTSTLFVGWSPNDLVDDDGDDGDGSDGNFDDGDGRGSNPGYDTFSGQAPSGSFGIEQFVDIPQAGQTIGGIGILPERGTTERRDN